MLRLPSEIWIADDDPEDLLRYQAALDDLHNVLPVIYFRNGYALLSDLITRPPDFCCYLIIDNRMPVLDGLGAIRQLAERDLLRYHHVTLISTRAAKGEEEYVKRLGVGFFEKPGRLSDLIKLFQTIL